MAGAVRLHSPQFFSPWLRDDEPVAAALDRDLDVDVAVIGAGYAGLCTALELRREGVEVAVLEAKYAGFGASGRNAGHLTPTIGKDVPTLLRVYGRQRAGVLIRLAETAIRYVEELIASLEIDCQYAPVGNVIAAVHPRQYGAIDRAGRAAAELGIHGELLDAAEMRRRGLPAAFTRGFLEPVGGVMHPGRYVRGLRRAAIAAGAALFEETPVTRVDEHRPALVHTPGGVVRARRVVYATNAYTPQLGVVRSKILPLYVQLFQTAPLSVAERAAVGWGGGEGIYTAHEVLESYRLTADGRIVGGSKFVRYGYGGRPLGDVDPVLSRRLEGVFRGRFPELPHTAVTSHWGGPIGLALDFLPVIRRGGPHDNIVHAVAYAGHGIALASYAGRMVADLLAGRSGPGAPLWSRRIISLPPEPLRTAVVKGLTTVFGWVDSRVDRALGRR